MVRRGKLGSHTQMVFLRCREALRRLLKELVEEFEVVRTGGNAGSSAGIDENTQVHYLPL